LSIDGSPIKQFKNLNSSGIPFLRNQPIRSHSSIWNGDDWTTRSGFIKIDWTRASFTFSFSNFDVRA
ncbi:xyloglucan:xyloglucosyl transferase, putative, partial [Ricinus communis]